MDQKKLTRIMKALAHEHRLQIYQDIVAAEKKSFDSKGECFVYDLCHTLGIGAPTISHHLKELEQAELIELRKIGKQLTATVNPKTAAYLKSYFQNF